MRNIVMNMVMGIVWWYMVYLCAVQVIHIIGG